MTSSSVSVSVSTETIKKLNDKINEITTLLNSLTPIAEVKPRTEPELKITYYDAAKTKKAEECYMLNRNLHGKYKYYYINGQIQTDGSYVSGYKHGIFINYREDGSVKHFRKYNMNKFESYFIV